MDEMTALSHTAQTQMSREETRNVVSWLCSPLADGAYVNLENALRRRIPGTGAWFFKLKAYHDWMKLQSTAIWITGLRE